MSSRATPPATNTRPVVIRSSLSAFMIMPRSAIMTTMPRLTPSGRLSRMPLTIITVARAKETAENATAATVLSRSRYANISVSRAVRAQSRKNARSSALFISLRPPAAAATTNIAKLAAITGRAARKISGFTACLQNVETESRQEMTAAQGTAKRRKRQGNLSPSSRQNISAEAASSSLTTVKPDSSEIIVRSTHRAETTAAAASHRAILRRPSRLSSIISKAAEPRSRTAPGIMPERESYCELTKPGNETARKV